MVRQLLCGVCLTVATLIGCSQSQPAPAVPPSRTTVNTPVGDPAPNAQPEGHSRNPKTEGHSGETILPHEEQGRERVPPAKSSTSGSGETVDEGPSEKETIAFLQTRCKYVKRGSSLNTLNIAQAVVIDGGVLTLTEIRTADDAPGKQMTETWRVHLKDLNPARVRVGLNESKYGDWHSVNFHTTNDKKLIHNTIESTESVNSYKNENSDFYFRSADEQIRFKRQCHT